MLSQSAILLGIVAVFAVLVVIGTKPLAKLGKFFLAAGFIIVLAFLAAASAMQASATRAAATAAAVASGGQTLATIALVVLSIAVLFLLAAVWYLYLRLRQAERRPRWAPGPNAYWRRAGEEIPAPSSAQAPADPHLLLLQQILYELHALRGLQSPSGPLSLPQKEDENVRTLFRLDEEQWW